jgi:hypothetical protein
MIKEEYIKVGSILQIERFDLIEITSLSFVDVIDPLHNIGSFFIKIIDIGNKMCRIKATISTLYSYNVDIVSLAKVADLLVFKTETEKSDADCFKTITDKMLDTYKAKNQDYGNSFSNLFKECGMTYAYGHMKEKLERVKSLMKDEAKVKGEGMKDSLKDLANYAILTIMELERKEEK